MLDAGEKHVALFYEFIPDACYKYRDRGDYDCIEFSMQVNLHDIPYVILFRNSHRSEAEKLHTLYNEGFSNYFERGADIERETGRILGYPEEAIEFYINRLRRHGQIA